MSSVVVLESDRPEQLDLLLRVAREMGIHVSLFGDMFEKMNDEEEKKLWLQTVLKAMEGEYLHKDNAHWDDFFKSTPKLR